jgi:HEAT repeat protein
MHLPGLTVAALFLLGIMAGPTSAQEPAPDVQQYFLKLIRQLRDGDPKVRKEAAVTVRMLAARLDDAALFLTANLAQDRDPEVRYEAALALRQIGPSANAAIPTLIRALDDKDKNVRMAAIGALAAMRPFSKPVIPRLVKFIQDKDPLIRSRAIGAVSMFGADAQPAIPAIMAALSDPAPRPSPKQPSVREYALNSLRRLGGDLERTGLALQQIREADEAKVKAPGFPFYAATRPDNRELVALLRAVLREEDYPELRRSAVYALGLLGRQAKDAVPELVLLLKKSTAPESGAQKKVRSAAIWCLGRIGPAAKEAISALRAIRDQGDAALREAVNSSLAAIERFPGP